MLGIFNNRKRINILESGIFEGLEDSHSHILPGVDDGVQTLEEALDALSYLESLGCTKVNLTPHITAQNELNIEEHFKAIFSDLKHAYTGKLELHLAAEYMLDFTFTKRLENQMLTIEDNQLLIETPFASAPKSLYGTLFDICSSGYVPLLAHPERYTYLETSSYASLKDRGCDFQLNLLSLLGVYGKLAEKKANYLLENNMYDALGTDLHSLPKFKAILEESKLTKRQITHLINFI